MKRGMLSCLLVLLKEEPRVCMEMTFEELKLCTTGTKNGNCSSKDQGFAWR